MELGQRSPVERITVLTAGLRRGADYLEVGSVLAAGLGVVAAVVLGFRTSGGNHPYVGLGLAVAASSIFGGLFNWCVARALHVYAEHTALSCSVDLDHLSPADRGDEPPATVPAAGPKRVRVRPHPAAPAGGPAGGPRGSAPPE